MSVRIRPLGAAKHEFVQRRNDLRIGYSRPAYLYSIPIYIHSLVGAADNHRDRTGGRLIRIPIKLPCRNRLTLLAAPGKKQTGVHRCPRGRVVVGDDNSRTFHRDSEQELGKFKREPDTSMGIGVTR